MHSFFVSLSFFFFNDTATTEIYTLSLHDALPISHPPLSLLHRNCAHCRIGFGRSEEHTSELQSHLNLVCRLLLEKKKKIRITIRGAKTKKKKDQKTEWE